MYVYEISEETVIVIGWRLLAETDDYGSQLLQRDNPDAIWRKVGSDDDDAYDDPEHGQIGTLVSSAQSERDRKRER